MHKATPIRLLAFSFLMAFALLFSSLTARAATTGGVEGTITSAETGRPLPSVKVTLLAPDGSVAGRANTDSKGQYSFTGVSPGAYTIATSIVTFKPITSSVTITQDQTATLNFSLEKSIRTGTTTVRVPPIPAGRQTQTATAQVVTARDEQTRKSQAYDLYQYPGILIGQPGFTEDPSTGLVSIRGADINQVGYQLDGVDITDPRTGYFGTNLVTTGLKSANVYTAGADASYGGHTGGFVNVITNNGRDIRGGVTEFTGPGSSNWNYVGTNTQYGNVIEGTKLDYYVSTIVFRNAFPDQVFGLKKVSSYDGLYKINYYADTNDTVTLEHTNGFEGYQLPADNSTVADANGNQFGTKFNESTNTFDNVGQYDGYENQTYMLDIFNYKHNFNNKSYGDLHYYRLRSGYEEQDPAADYVTEDDTKQGLNTDYLNQLSKNDQFRAGYYYEPSGETLREAFIDGPDYNELVHTYQSAAYITNSAKLANNKLVFDSGLRYATQKYDLPDRHTAAGVINKSYNTDYLDPRLGLTYSLNPSLLIRSNYSITSQFADAGRTGYLLGPDAVGLAITKNADGTTNTYTDAQAQARYGTGNQLKAEHSSNYDLGLEKGIIQSAGLLSGAYDVQLNGYRRHQWNQLLYERVSYVPLGGARTFTNNGKADATGVEFLLTKRQRKESDLGAFVSYSNQVEKNTSALENGYLSYFYNAFDGSASSLGITNAEFTAANRAEYPAPYAQRHTVYAQVTKRLNKLFETSLNFDAGSGYPFGNGTTTLTNAALQGVDAQHGVAVGDGRGAGSSTFSSVPVVVPNGSIQPLVPVPGHTGWHYKFSLNSNLYLTKATNLFFNVDNIFDRLNALIVAPEDARGNLYYEAPSAAYPQGRINYGPNIVQTPVQVTFGFRTKF